MFIISSWIRIAVALFGIIIAVTTASAQSGTVALLCQGEGSPFSIQVNYDAKTLNGIKAGVWAEKVVSWIDERTKPPRAFFLDRNTGVLTIIPAPNERQIFICKRAERQF